MWESCDAVDWSALTHAHGPAGDVPGALRALLSDDEDARMQACGHLHETLWHQGTVYPASAAVVPLLCALLTDPAVPDRRCVLSLLLAIATGEGGIRYALRVDGPQRLRQRLARSGGTLEAALAREDAAMAAIHQGLSPHLHALLPHLDDTDGAAPLVAEVLGRFPEHASWLVPAIDAALARTSDPHLRQTLAASRERLVGP